MTHTSTSGRTTSPGDPDYDADRMPWNVFVDQRPAAVVSITDPAQVSAAILAARAAGHAVSAQPRGHGATGSLAGSVLLRTGGLQEISIDRGRRVARVGAGVRWGELLGAIDGTGLIALAGSSPDVSVVGYLLGGGLSWFGRKYGPAGRCVRAVELVDADGRAARVTAESDPDLFWALRGGGGEFGIVTAIEIDLYEEPLLTGGKLMFPGEQAAAVLGAVAELAAVAPPELTIWAGILHMPPNAPVPELRGKTFAVVDAVYLGDEQRCKALLWTIREAGTAVYDTVAPITVGQIGGVSEEPVDPMPSMDLGIVLHGLDAQVIERIVSQVGAGSGTPLTTVMVRHVGGALAQRLPDDGVFGQVDGEYVLFGLGVPAVPELVPAIEDSFAALRTALADVCADRVPLNFLGSLGIEAAYAEVDLERLRAIKRSRDPGNVIQGNRPLL
jgi:FAD/FMN-containing dehydrogenase